MIAALRFIFWGIIALGAAAAVAILRGIGGGRDDAD